jgi:hypothetical protein
MVIVPRQYCIHTRVSTTQILGRHITIGTGTVNLGNALCGTWHGLHFCSFDGNLLGRMSLILHLVLGLGVSVFVLLVLGLTDELMTQIPQLAPVGFILVPLFFQFCFLKFHHFLFRVVLLLLLMLLLRVIGIASLRDDNLTFPSLEGETRLVPNILDD